MSVLVPEPLPGAYDAIEDIVYILDAQRRFTYVNAFALRAWQRGVDEVLGRTLEEGLPMRPAQEVIDRFQQAICRQERHEFESFGTRHQRRLIITLYPHHGGVLVQVRPTLRDVQTAAATDHDALTGCLTRLAFLRAHREPDRPHVLALIDLNRLKAVNSLRGHGGGDLHILQVTQCLQEVMPEDTIICRWGGDEFVLLASTTDPGRLDAALIHAQELAPSPFPGMPAFSFGLTVWPMGTPYERAFALADDHLQHQKDSLNSPVSSEEDLLDFVEFSQYLQTLNDPDDIIEHALTQLLTLLDFDHAVYQVWEGESYRATHQVIRPGLAQPQPPLGTRMPLSGAFLSVQRSQRTVWATDYPTSAEVIPLMVDQGIKSGIMTPVFSQGRIIATITLRTVHRWHTITPRMRKVVELVALRLEHALELRRAVSDVRATLEGGLLMLGVALEARDLETYGHTERATQMATALGTALGLRGTELDHLREGAYLHDLGKLCVPDAILQKPGALTLEEWKVMQTHTSRGWALARHIPSIAPAVLDVIRHHHERWNGTGYPDQLMGTGIPLLARIFAVIDVYDALVSERPYKRAWTPEAALEEIEAQAGLQFDPEIVRAFVILQRQERPFDRCSADSAATEGERPHTMERHLDLNRHDAQFNPPDPRAG